MKVTGRRAGVAVVAVAGAALAVYAALPKPEAVQVAPVVRGPLQVCVEEDATTRVRERYDVAAPIAARLRRVNVHAGDRVEAGQPVVVLDPSPLDPRTESQLRARVSAAESARREASTNVLTSRATHELAARELRRIEKIAREGIASSEELDRARNTEKVAARELEAATARAVTASWEAEATKSALQAADDLRELTLRAPVTGKVLRVLQESESVVAAGTRLLEIGDPTDVEVVVDLLTTDAVRVLPGARVIIKDWGGDAPLEARVRRVEPGGFTKVSALGVEEQRVNVLADLERPEPRLGDGFRVTACVVLWQGTALKVPNMAVFSSANGPAVYVVEEGRVKLRGIRLGQTGMDESQVLAGLVEAQRVVIHPSDRIRDGSKVRVTS